MLLERPLDALPKKHWGPDVSMRPVMGAPDDTPFIHGMIDRIEELEAKNKKLREALEAILRCHSFTRAKEISREALRRTTT